VDRASGGTDNTPWSDGRELRLRHGRGEGSGTTAADESGERRADGQAVGSGGGDPARGGGGPGAGGIHGGDGNQRRGGEGRRGEERSGEERKERRGEERRGEGRGGEDTHSAAVLFQSGTAAGEPQREEQRNRTKEQPLAERCTGGGGRGEGRMAGAISFETVESGRADERTAPTRPRVVGGAGSRTTRPPSPEQLICRQPGRVFGRWARLTAALDGLG